MLLPSIQLEVSSSHFFFQFSLLQASDVKHLREFIFQFAVYNCTSQVKSKIQSNKPTKVEHTEMLTPYLKLWWYLEKF